MVIAKFFRESARLSETAAEIVELAVLAIAAGVIGGLLLSSVLNHEIAEVNAARVTLEIPCP
jgi:Mg2+/citrate symporter